jgi:hypothetical protein
MPLFSADYFFDFPKNIDFSVKVLRDLSEWKGSTIKDV